MLQEAKLLAGAGSLIRAEMSYRDQLNRFKAQTAQAGIGLRAAGGRTAKKLSADQKVIDRQARLTISRELGHEREQVTAVHLGR